MPKKKTDYRPGCVSALAIVLWFAGGLYVFVAAFIYTFTVSGAAPESPEQSIGLTISVLGLAVAILAITAGIGLWLLTSWGWVLILILQVISLLGLIGVLMVSASVPDQLTLLSAAGSILIAIMINVGMLGWFVKNRSLFLVDPTAVS